MNIIDSTSLINHRPEERKNGFCKNNKQTNARQFRTSEDLLYFSSDEEDDRGPNKAQYSSTDKALDSTLYQENQLIKRLVIIDGCNVMHACSTSMILKKTSDGSEKFLFSNFMCRSFMKNRPPPNAIGLFMLGYQLLKAGFDFRAFLPMSYLSGEKEVENDGILKKMHQMGYVIQIEDYSHDDLVLLELAKASGGFVISNDKFADHLHIEALKDVIENYVVRFNFKRQSEQDFETMYLKSKYFYGAEIVLMPKNIRAMYSVDQNDPTFGMVFCQRVYRRQNAATDSLCIMNAIADYLYQKVCAYLQYKPPSLPYYNPEIERLPTNVDIFINYWLSYNQTKRK